jgi:hypothetical protein
MRTSIWFGNTARGGNCRRFERQHRQELVDVEKSEVSPATGDSATNLWGGQFCPQPAFSRLGRLKGGCGQDWPPHSQPPVESAGWRGVTDQEQKSECATTGRGCYGFRVPLTRSTTNTGRPCHRSGVPQALMIPQNVAARRPCLRLSVNRHRNQEPSLIRDNISGEFSTEQHQSVAQRIEVHNGPISRAGLVGQA